MGRGIGHGRGSGLYRSSESNVSLSTVAAINATVKGEGTATVFAGESINGQIRGGKGAVVAGKGQHIRFPLSGYFMGRFRPRIDFPVCLSGWFNHYSILLIHL